MLQNLKGEKNINYSVKTIQDYSFFNHLNWFLNEKPLKTGKVGGDYISLQIDEKLSNNKIGIELKDLIIKFNTSYQRILEKNHIGNIIIAEVNKNNF